MAIRPNIIAAALLLAAIPMAAANAATAPAERACFAANNWEGWSSPGDGDALLLRVGVNDIYRVELTPGTHVHKRGDQFIVNRIRGSNWICSALDLDLDLSDHHGFRQPLIARSLRRLAPAEVAAIPRKDLP